MLEKEVWRAFKGVWPWHAERQEPGIGAGQPDVLCTDSVGTAGLIELKASNRLQLNPYQVVWHRRWQKAGGRSVVLSSYRVRRELTWMVWYGEAVFYLDREDALITTSKGDMIHHVTMCIWEHLP